MTQRQTPKKRETLEGLDAIIGKMITHTKLGKHLEHALIWEHWAEIVGEKLAPHAHPVTVAEMRLCIEADSAVVMHQISLLKWPIVRRVNTLARKELINDVYVALLPDGDEVSLEKSKERPGKMPRGVNRRHIRHARPDDGSPAAVRKPQAGNRPRRRGST